jgi:predicted RNase H-like nuclease (RuvC/YqgF family)
MLSKLLFVISSLALAGGTYLGFKNRQDFIATRNEKIEINSQQVKPTLAKIDEEIANIGTEIGKWKDAVASKKEKEVALANAQANLKAKNNDLAKVGTDIQEKQTELTTLEAKLAELLGNETIDTITAKLETLNQEIASLQTDKENANKEYEVAKGKINALESTVASLRRASAERNKGINLNAVEGTVIATNQDYGFAVVNIGQNKGLSGGSKLIVKRGNQRIGTLNVSSISASKTIADIEAGSVPAGVAISPGDTVILEKVQR